MSSEYIIREIFKYFYEKVYQRPTPTNVYDNDRGRWMIKEFAASLDESRQGEWIWNYTLFQFGRYIGKIRTNSFASGGTLTPSMVYGKKPQEVFANRRQDMDWIAQYNPLLIDYKISKEELAFRKGISFKVKIKQSVYQDLTKAIAIRGLNPLDTCIDMTDLYSPTDISCDKCADKQMCQIKLKELYPQIAKVRGL